jgi:hypothetical protein
MEYLAIADADKIHDYVFGPRLLKLIRGGSALQSDLNQDILPKLASDCGGKVISKAGGTVIARFARPELASQFCTSAEARFASETKIATVTTAVTPYDENHFRHDLLRAQQKLELAKQAREEYFFDGGRPFWAHCEYCGQHPAAERLEGKGLCRACRSRLNNSDRSRYYPPDVLPAENLEAIGAIAEPKGYLAVIYLDFDQMGKTLAEIATTEQRYSKFSFGMEYALTDAIRSSCERLLPSAGNARYEILLMGGDDAVLALPAHCGLQFVLDFAEVFRAKFTENTDSAFVVPKFSAGILFSHQSFPISEYLRHAEELMRLAKSVAGVNSVDFEILSGAMSRGIVRERQRVSRKPSETDEELARTMRPYTLEGMTNLLANVREVRKKVPSSKLNALYRFVFQNQHQAQFEYDSMLLKLNEPAANALRAAVGPELWQRRQNGTLGTAVTELVELQEFAGESSN